MKKKIIIVICLIVIIVLAMVLIQNRGRNPFKDLDASEIASASVKLMPPDEEFPIAEVKELVELLREVEIYRKDNSYTQYAGQACVFTLTKTDGTKTEINAYNPFVIIDGVGYRCKYEPTEALNHYANELLNRYNAVAKEETEPDTADEAETMTEPESEDVNSTEAGNEADWWGITLSVKDVTDMGLTLVVSQSGGRPTGELEFGSAFSLEVLENGEWVDVPARAQIGWTEEAYIVAMEGSVEQELTWKYLYGSLGAGTYRITKSFMDFRGIGDYDTMTFSTEFEIE